MAVTESPHAVGYGAMNTHGGDRPMPGPEFRQLREERFPHINMQDFAQRAGVSLSTLAKYEEGHTKKPRDDFRRRIMAAIETIDREERGVTPTVPPSVKEWEVRPGVWITYRAEHDARLGDALDVLDAVERAVVGDE